MKNRLTTAYILSIISVIPIFFMSISPLIGERVKEILFNSVYALFSPLVDDRYQYPINIAVLIVFIVSLIYSFRESYRGRLVWLGCVFYFVYIQIVFSLEQLLFFKQDDTWRYLWGHFFEQTTAYFFPFFLSLAAFIIGLKFILKEDPPRQLPNNLPMMLPALLLSAYSVVLIIRFFSWIKLDYLSFTIDHNFNNLYIAGSAPFVDMVLTVPLFIYCSVSILKSGKIAPVFICIALFKAMTPFSTEYLWDTIKDIIRDIHRGMSHEMYHFITRLFWNPLQAIEKNALRELDGYESYISIMFSEIIFLLIICSIILFFLFHYEIKKHSVRNKS